MTSWQKTVTMARLSLFAHSHVGFTYTERPQLVIWQAVRLLLLGWVGWGWGIEKLGNATE